MAKKGQAIFDGLIARGIPELQAAVLTGNIQAESGFSPTAWNAGEGAGGLLQWRLDRLTDLQRFAQETGRDIADQDVQLDYLVNELQGPKEGRNAEKFFAAADPQTANEALKAFIRYAPGSENARLNYALGYMPTAEAAPVKMADNSAALRDKYFGTEAKVQEAFPSTPAIADLREKYFAEAQGAPEGAVPGSREYADWAAEQARAGKPLPMVSEPPPEWQEPSPTGPMDKFVAGYTGAVEGVPILGPTLLEGVENLRSTVQGMPVEDVQAEREVAQAANPMTTMAGNITGAVAGLGPLAMTATGAKLLGMAGSLGARALFGAGSGAAITGADTLARGGSMEDAASNALIGATVGGMLPAVTNRLGAAWNALKGPSADRVLSNALQAEGIAPAQVNALLAQRGAGTVLADLGPNLQQLAGGLGAVPGPAQTIVKKAIAERAANAGNRLLGDVDAALGQGLPPKQLLDQVTAAQKAAADPLYTAVRPTVVQVTPVLAAMQKTPLGKRAYDKAVEMLQNDGLNPNVPTVALYDAMKRSLDDIAGAAVKGNERNAARQASEMAAALRNEIDAQVPAYATARDAFAGPELVKEALDLGRDVFTRKMTPDELRQAVANMTTSEQEALLVGAQDAVQNIIGNARTDVAGVKQAFSSDFAKEKLAILLGPDAAEIIERGLAREAAIGQTNQLVAGNSVTAARQEAQKMVAPETARLPSTQTAFGWLTSLLEKTRLGLTAKYREAQNKGLANMLMSPGLTQGAEARIAGAAPNARNALVAPASVPVLAEQNQALPRLPIEILVRGGNPLLAQ